MVIQLNGAGVLYVVFKQQRMILGTLAVFMALAVLYCFLTTPLYESSTQLVANFTKAPSTAPGPTSQSNVGTPMDHEEVINSYVLMLSATELAEEVIRTIGLETVYPSIAARSRSDAEKMEDAVTRLHKKDLKIQSVKDSNVITVTVLNSDPHVAQRIAALVADRFIARQAGIARDPRSAFVNDQLQFYRGEVAKTQDAMAQFQVDKRIFSFDEERTFLIQERSTLEAQLYATQSRLAEDKEKSAELREHLTHMPGTLQLVQGDRDPSLEAARSSLTDLKLRQHELMLTYRSDSQAVRDITKKIENVQAFISSFADRSPLKRTEPNTAFSQTQVDLTRAAADLKAAEASVQTTQSQLDSINVRLADRSRQQPTFQDLVRQYQLADQNYRSYLQGVQESRVDEDLNRAGISNISVFDRADVPQDSKYPMIPLVLALSAVLGTMFGVALAFTREILDERLNTPDQVSAILGLPVLGSMGLVRR
jgi:uncharacterized protein involved in exopolysaccharide biosynthesis